MIVSTYVVSKYNDCVYVVPKYFDRALYPSMCYDSVYVVLKH
jgi:hypothetical protein